MTDTNALRSIIADSGLKYKAIAEIMGLTPYALQMKIDNETEFKASEIDTLANTLGMDMQQRDSIFFARKWNLITLLQVHPKEVKKMSNSKRPHAPKEEKRGAQEIQLSHLDNRFSCQIDGTVIQNVKDYSLVQSSNGKALLNLTIEISAEVVSTTIQAQMQQHL